MLEITLVDGTKKSFSAALSVMALAESIGPGLAKATLAGEVNGQLVDASYLIESDAEVKIITGRDELGLAVIRHSTAHLLAQAVKALFPTAQVTIGPVIDDGFYYDFAFERPFTPDDLVKIEAKMQALVKADLPVVRKVLTREQAIALFHEMGEHYKVQIIEEIPAGETIAVYQQGDFMDLCRGPHVPRTGVLKAFKLTKLAGAYWRGDSNNEMLQRIYGTAWQDKKALKAYLQRIAEAEKRDHRLLAKKMDLFHLQPEAPGMIFWHPNGWSMIMSLRNYIREKLGPWGYEEINTPQLVDGILWEKSGHKAKFDDDMFATQSENREYIVKPMSCPCHVQVFKQGLKSYRDLPIRYAEFGCCHRNEPSGTMHGLMRVRALVQDDGHVFCTEDQITAEAKAFLDQIHEAYADLGFVDIIHRLSTRPDKRVGSDAIWDKAEAALQAVLDAKGVDWELQPGEGAFYGPKIEFSLRDCLGRIWQCGTLQLDFSMAERLGAYYIDEHGEKRSPVMLHRAMLGSFERFLGILLEEYAGKMPLWLAPVQVVLLNITDKQSEFVQQVTQKLQKLGFRVKSDLRNEKIGFKIREHTIAKVPYLAVVGDREVANDSLAIRTLGGEQSEVMTVADFVAKLQQEIAERSRRGGIKD